MRYSEPSLDVSNHETARMKPKMLSTEFLITFLVVVLVPGTGVIYFLLAFLPLFVSADTGSPALQMFLLSGIFMGMTLVIFILHGMFAYSVRAYVVTSPRIVQILQRSFAAIFAVLGAKLAFSEQ